MTTSKNIVVRFIADTSKFEKGAGKAGAGLDNFSAKANQAKEFLKGFIEGIPSPIKIATVAITGLAAAFPKVVSAGIEAEDALTKLEVLFKDGSKASELYRKSLDFSTITPFDPKDVVQGVVVAGQYGVEAFDKIKGTAKDAITLVADMASFSGQSMNEAATALFRGDLALLDKYGKQGRAAYKDALKAGQLGSEQFISKFVQNMAKVDTWSGMAEKRSKTVSGIWSTILGNVGLIFTYLSGAAEGGGVVTFWSNLRDMMGQISDKFAAFVAYIKPALVEIGQWLGNFFRTFFEVLKTAWIAMEPIVKPILGLLFFAFMASLKIANVLLRAIIKVLQFIQAAWKFFFGVLDSIFGISNNMESLAIWTGKFINYIKAIWFFIANGMEATVDYFIDGFRNRWPKAVAEGVADAKNAIKSFLGMSKSSYGVTMGQGPLMSAGNQSQGLPAGLAAATSLSSGSGGNTYITNQSVNVTATGTTAKQTANAFNPNPTKAKVP